MSNSTSPQLFIPNVDDVLNLKPGDLALDCFAKWSPVTSISFRGTDIKGKAYVGFFTSTGPTSSISGTYKVGELVRTVPVTKMLTSNETTDAERYMNSKGERLSMVHHIPQAAYLSLIHPRGF